MNTRSRSSGAIPSPVSATSTSIPLRDRLGADDHAAVGRRMPDRVLDQVEQHALELLGVGARRAQRVGQLGEDRDALGLGLDAHRLDRLADELARAAPARATS